MKREIVLLVLVAGTVVGSQFAQARGPINLKSEDVTFPHSTRALPDGAGRAAVQNNCLSCHSAGMILTQPTMAKGAWEAEVAKMRNVYKAPVNEQDVPAIVDYLTAVKDSK